ncbi:hypothetical protein D3C87_1491720 [compost metagenome]
MQTNVAARRAVGVVVGEAHARHEVQDFVDRLAGGLRAYILLGDGRAGLGIGLGHNAFDGARTASTGDNDVADLSGAVLDRLRGCRLGRSGAGHEDAAHEGGGRPEQLFAVGHQSVSPVM